jgi:hypothetical protein
MKRCTMWWGTASDHHGNYQWYYEPRSRLSMMKQEPLIPRCWMNIDPPLGAKRAILKAVRAVR